MAITTGQNSGRRSHPRAGVYRRQPTGYSAFLPARLPFKPPLDLTRLEPGLSHANLAVGRLDGIAEIVPDPDLFVTMYVRNEAVLSSRIEGTQASLSDVLDDEAGIPTGRVARPADVAEVRNYVNALNRGLARLETLPLSLRLLKEMHEALLHGVRGKDKTPGEFRRTQNWIGPEGCTLQDAVFVPPPPAELMDSLADLEKYIRGDDPTPVLVRAGIAHAQFETIHPFLDGNGRLGRLLITFMLCERRVLRRPLLYLSAYFSARKEQYYAWLMRVREEGDWEGWLQFYLSGVEDVAGQAAATAQEVLTLQAHDRELVRQHLPRTPNALKLLEVLYLHPTVTVRIAADLASVSIPTANTLIKELVRAGILIEMTGRGRDRVFQHMRYLHTLARL